MTRWSLKNSFSSVTHQQFVNYTEQFKEAVEQSFGTDCQLKIVALTAPKSYSTFWDDRLQDECKKTNARNLMMETSDLEDITPSEWARARYVEVIVTPVDPEKAPPSAFAHIEFKGKHNHQATFYIQPAGDDAKQRILSRHFDKLVGDGFEPNGERLKKQPASMPKVTRPFWWRLLP